MSKDSEDKKKIRLPGILLGVAIVLAIVVAILHAVPCIPVPVPAGQPAPEGDPAKVETPKKAEEPKKPADLPVPPVDPTTGGLVIDKPDLGLTSPSLK